MRTLTKTTQSISLLLISLTALSGSLPTLAQTEELVIDYQSKQSLSLGSLKKTTVPGEQLIKMKQLQQNKANNLLLTPTTNKVEKTSKSLLRAERIEQKKKSVLANSLVSRNKNSNIHYSFAIYDAYVQLIEDFDADGFYQTFSVTFDADILSDHSNDHAVVYADLYLSKDGGPWVHYFTTENFSIHGESTEDVYEVYTNLNQGYPSDDYDVLIDLYEVGFEDVVATISSNDTNNLYALPLESSDYDPDYVVVQSTSHGHGGSSSILGLFMMMLVILKKKMK